jgi:hypothetical protein
VKGVGEQDKLSGMSFYPIYSDPTIIGRTMNENPLSHLTNFKIKPTKNKRGLVKRFRLFVSKCRVKLAFWIGGSDLRDDYY